MFVAFTVLPLGGEITVNFFLLAYVCFLIFSPIITRTCITVLK